MVRDTSCCRLTKRPLLLVVLLLLLPLGLLGGSNSNTRRCSWGRVPPDICGWKRKTTATTGATHTFAGTPHSLHVRHGMRRTHGGR